MLIADLTCLLTVSASGGGCALIRAVAPSDDRMRRVSGSWAESPMDINVEIGVEIQEPDTRLLLVIC
jgi:hypothetical protein